MTMSPRSAITAADFDMPTTRPRSSKTKAVARSVSSVRNTAFRSFSAKFACTRMAA